MQFPGQAPVVGVVYATTMSRPDSALALALLYGLQGKREARMAAISVSGAGIETAAFCDAVGRFYSLGPLANSNRVLPIGLAADGPLPSDPPMIKAAMKRLDSKGAPLFVNTTANLGDTSEPCALIRNALTAQADAHAVVIVSAPSTYVARVLNLQGTRELIGSKVRALVLCDIGGSQDVTATRKLLAEWPSPVVLCPKGLGDAVLYPAASIEKDFAWSPAHPVVDAYRAFRPMPYDCPTLDMAAMLYAIHPESEFFEASSPGTIQIADNGSLDFVPGSEGKHRSLQLNAARKDELLKQYITVASAKPVPPPARRNFGKQADPAAKPAEAPKPAAPVKPIQP